MALSGIAVQAAAQTAVFLVGKVLQSLQAVAKAHIDREKDVELVRLLHGKLQDRCLAMYGVSHIPRWLLRCLDLLFCLESSNVQGFEHLRLQAHDPWHI